MTTLAEADVDAAALDWLSGLGWSVAHGPDIASGEETIAEFHRIGQDFARRIRSNVAESRALAAQRDTLLPGLVSGEVGVGSADIVDRIPAR